MGLGKTATIQTCIWDWIVTGESKAVLVIGPIRVIEAVWEDEAKEWRHLSELKFSLIRGSPKQRLAALQQKAHVYLINPELVPWLFQEVLAKKYRKKEFPFDSLVIDESTMFKSPGSRRFRAIRYRLHRFKHRVVMTGTPSPHSLMDLWSQMFIVDLGEALGDTFEHFKHRFFYPVDAYLNTWVPIEGAKEKIEKLIAPKVLTLTAEAAGIDTPMIENPVWVDLPPKARRIYNDLEKQMWAELDTGTVTAFTASSKSMRCRQVAQGAIYMDDEQKEWEEIHDAKLDALDEIVHGTGDNLLVCYEFRHDLERIRERYKPVIMNEGDSRKIKDAWNRREIPMLVLHPASAGHGLNLQFGGSTVVFFGLTFNFEWYSQTIRRLKRPGQSNPVMVHQIAARNTTDVAILRTLKGRDKNQASLLSALMEYRRDKSAAHDHPRRS